MDLSIGCSLNESELRERRRTILYDRDPLYTKEFLSILKDAGVLSVKLPPRSPKFESICGKICPHDQGRLSGANDPLRPRRSAQSDSGVRCNYHLERNRQGLRNRSSVQ